MSGEVHALFSQYENEYCSKSTELARKTQAIGSLSGGESDLCCKLGVYDLPQACLTRVGFALTRDEATKAARGGL